MASITPELVKKERTFRYGFLLAPEQEGLADDDVKDWPGLRLHGFQLWVHPEASLRLIHLRQGSVAFIGDVFVAHSGRTLEEIADDVLSDRWESYDDLSGRFAAIALTGDSVRVANDPFGSRTVSYRLGARAIVSSHSALLARAIGEPLSPSWQAYKDSPEQRAKKTRFLPGDATMYDRIVQLPPNNYLNAVSGKTTRFWPRRPIESVDIETFMAVADEYFTNFALFLGRTYTPVIGLTGGGDSRTLIAALKRFGLNPRLLTWNTLPSAENARLPRIIAHLGLEHSYLDVASRETDAVINAFREAAYVSAGYSRWRAWLPARSALTAGPRDVFVRGLGGEILGSAYHTSQVRSRGSRSEVFEDLFLTTAVVAPSDTYVERTRTAIQQFMDRANYDAELFGVDPGALYYWEQRMANWAAILLAEQDPGMPSLVGFNSRRLYEAAWGLPDDIRFGKSFMRSFMATYDKVLSEL
jgi:hypothetical protein